MTDYFAEKAPLVMADLIRDLALTVEDAAAVLGNIGHECNGFRSLQEIRPVVAGSRGGYGWCQWTGPRRRAFEVYCAMHDLVPASDAANYGYLVEELRGPEKRSLAALGSAQGLPAKVVAFEAAFLRAGIPHDDSRVAWAERALAAFRAAAVPPTPHREPPAAVRSLWARLSSLFNRKG